MARDRALVCCLVLHDRRERFGIEAGAADQCAIDFLFRHQGFGVVGLHAAAVEDARGCRRTSSPKAFAASRADERVSIGGHLRSGGLAGADGPDGFVGDDQFCGLLRGDAVEGARCTGGAEHLR